MDEREMTPCAECGMPCREDEYHPYAACLMFKACNNSDTVRGNLQDVLDAGRRTTPDREAWQPIETAPKDGTPLVMFARYIHATASIVVIASWIESYGTWVNQSFSGNPIQEVVPSHWMPRPEFPTSDKGD